LPEPFIAVTEDSLTPDSAISNSITPRRGIRSFVIRAGRMTAGQTRALAELWPQHGIEFANLDLNQAFANAVAPRMIEIGFGNGDALAAFAAQYPNHHCVGIEVHRPGVGHLLLKVEELALTNVRVICHDAVQVLTSLVPHSVDEIHIFFPDPWHKKRHHKRRLIQPPFIELLARVLKPGGIVRLATDWEHYAEQMRAVMNESAQFTTLSDASGFVARPAHRPLTRFERRGHRLGHGVWDLAYKRHDL
jgi:tRNA (guanine-N7-)-methyltransferase